MTGRGSYLVEGSLWGSLEGANLEIAGDTLLAAWWSRSLGRDLLSHALGEDGGGSQSEESEGGVHYYSERRVLTRRQVIY